jgi:iron(III) transport system substrate-binding protein
LIVLVLAAAAIGCASDKSPAPGGEIVLYTSIPDSVVDRLQGVVEQRFPDMGGNWMPMGEGITLRVVRGRTADIEQRLADELESGMLRADVIWLAEPSSLERYKDLGLLARYQPPPDTPIPASYIDPDGFYVAGRVISMALAWNTDLMPGRLDDWSDLLDTTSSGFPAPESGAARATIHALLDEYGTGFFTTLGRLGGVSVPSNDSVRNGLVSHRFEAGAVLDYMARQAKEGGLPIDYAYPATGTVLIPSPIALTADARNPEAAKRFVDFILSRSGQEIIVQIGSFYPVRTDVDPPAGAPPLSTIAAFDVDWDEVATDVPYITEFWDSCFGPRSSLVSD